MDTVLDWAGVALGCVATRFEKSLVKLEEIWGMTNLPFGVDELAVVADCVAGFSIKVISMIMREILQANEIRRINAESALKTRIGAARWVPHSATSKN